MNRPSSLLGIVALLWSVVSVVFGAVALALALFAFLCAVLVPVGNMLECRRIVLQNEDRGGSTCMSVGSVAGFLAIILAPVGTLGHRLLWSWVPLAIEASVVLLLTVSWIASGLGKLNRRQTLARRARTAERDL